MVRADAVENRAFRLLLAAFGAVCVGVSLGHLILGVGAIPGAIAVSPTNDSEDRFYATLFAFFGFAIIWCARDPRRRITALRALMLVFFIGGVGRVFSVMAVGLPHPLFVALGISELAIPILFWWVDRTPPSAWLPDLRTSSPVISPKSVLARLIFVFGACCCVIALAYLLIGGPAVPGGSRLNATMDSEVRFYASLFLGFGSALIWTSFDLTGRRLVLRYLLLAFFAAGCARVVSWICVGPPNALFVSQLVLEVTLPLVLWIWFRATERPEVAE